MHLEQLTVERFRSCAATTVAMRPHLTVLVGENNGGKSNIMDAIRLLTLPLNGRKERYPEDEDLRRGSAEATFNIEACFSGLSETLRGLLISAVPDPTVDRATFGMTYQIAPPGGTRGRTTYWAGQFGRAEPESGATELIRHVFLPPLRDARQALGSGSATRITALLQHFLGPGEEAAFLEHVRRTNTPHKVVEAVNTEIASALGNLTRGVRAQTASLEFTTEALSDVARDLRFRLADAGIPPQDIRTSGLGYANLLYMATVVVELAKAREADLTLFLVEEPEAHLHPQLQTLVLDFLLEEARKSAERAVPSGQPEGRIQVIVTTHSPNLTAWVSPEHLVVVRSERDETVSPPVHRTVAIPIATLGLTNPALQKVSRYLDVTRSALLFGNRVLLVEGIAEALLLPAIAKHLVLTGDPHAWQRFRGTVIVPIDGVDFAPYVEILLRPAGASTVADRVVVVTDSDPDVPGNRKSDLEKLAALFGASEKLCVVTNAVTLEHELFTAGNEHILQNAFLALYPQSGARWKAAVSDLPPDSRAEGFVSLLKDKQTRKGDFAQRLADRIEAGESFCVPNYLNRAIQEAASE